MRKIICIMLILAFFPLPVMGFSWQDAKPIERPHINWSWVTKDKILATRDHPEILLGTVIAGCWMLTHTQSGKKFYKANLKGDFAKLSKVQGRKVRIK